MKFYKLLPIFALIIVHLSCKAQELDSRILLVPATIDQEATSIWSTINAISFFEEQGYSVRLPKDEKIDSLIAKSKNGSFGNDDFSVIYNLLEDKLFHADHYKEATKKVKEQYGLINSMLQKIEAKKEAWDWKFKSFDTYKIIFTLYGTGGSYNPDEGSITLLTNKDGSFMNYKNPANTIIHEISHMGMEYSLVQKYELSHGTKERLVDTFVYLMFHEDLPEYKIQPMGDTKMDEIIPNQKKIKSLDALVSKFTD